MTRLLLAALLLGCGDGGGGAGEGKPPGVVAATYTKELFDGCRYEAQLAGSLAERGSGMYAADLRVHANVRCPPARDLQPAGPQQGLLRRRHLGRQELVSRLELLASVPARQGRQRCLYTPLVDVQDASVRFRGVRYFCTNGTLVPEHPGRPGLEPPAS